MLEIVWHNQCIPRASASTTELVQQWQKVGGPIFVHMLWSTCMSTLNSAWCRMGVSSLRSSFAAAEKLYTAVWLHVCGNLSWFSKIFTLCSLKNWYGKRRTTLIFPALISRSLLVCSITNIHASPYPLTRFQGHSHLQELENLRSIPDLSLNRYFELCV